ncbi:ATP-binding protein [Streptomyces sp. NPDC058644]|uniref:ATP-binding protein n=1 Tax=unclassified Streptomyces TaxID=2593676 RepID=UPI0036683AEE
MVGRRTELAEVVRLVKGPARLVTLTGVGGVGKTRLALEAAARLRPAFWDGVWLVELSPLSQGEALPYAIVEALPLVDQTTRPMLDVLAEYLADRELLLVLDTCEHLADECALTVQALMRAAPGLRILATSRRPLNVPGAEVLTVEPLPIPGPGDPAAAAEADAVVLLAERAAQRVPGLAADAAGRADLVGLARRLEGLPLAIELAAARLGELSVRELTERLDDRFAVLGDTDKVVHGAQPPWHQALRTAIGWSHQLCSPAERLLWARLSVFAGTFDAEAARMVCADWHLPADRITGLLAALVDKSIVAWQPTAGGERYRMLDTLREYGADWLRRLGEAEELRCRHRTHYRALALRADAAWMGPDQLAWYERASADHSNFRTALDFCLGEGDDGDAALELAGALWFLWLACGLQHAGRHYLDRALQQYPTPSPARSKAVWACGAIALGQGDLDTVAVRTQELRADAEASADPAMLVAAAHLEGGYLGLSGQPAQAAAVFDAAPYTRDHGAAYSGARFLVWTIRVFAHTNLGEFAQAAAAADAMRAQCLTCGDRWAQAFADYVRGLAALGLGQLDEATAYARASLQAKALLRDSIGIGTSIDLLASITAATGRGEPAARLLGIGQQAWNAIGRNQLGVPELLAARQACERQARDSIGDDAYEAAFRKGMEDSIDDGITYALHQT